MGAYEEYMKSLQAAGMGPLRPVEVEPQAKPHAFGNPFKIDKKNMSIIDEVINSKSANTLIWFKATSSKVLIHKSVRLFLEQKGELSDTEIRIRVATFWALNSAVELVPVK